MTFFLLISGLRKVKKEHEEEKSGQENNNNTQVVNEGVKWRDIVADLSIILGKFPREVAKNMTLFQALAIKDADYRNKQFGAGIHGVQLPDKNIPKTEDGRPISSLDDVLSIAGAGKG